MTNPASAGQDVSSRTEAALRSAMTRLLAGQPRCTDGRLTKANLGREAGISHATLHRAKTILAEWDTAVATHEPTQAERQTQTQQDETADLRARLATKSTECSELRRRLDAAATVIATLHHENAALRQQLDRSGGVISLSPRAAATVGSPTGPADSGTAAARTDPDIDAT